MSHSKEIPCPTCGGDGWVWDYAARDLVMGQNEVPDHTMQVECGTCLGQGHIREDPPIDNPPTGIDS